MRNYHDKDLGREIVELLYKGSTYRLPAEIGERFVTGSTILCAGGFGVLITARDRLVFNRKVLLKKAILPDHLFMVQRNAAVAREVEAGRERMDLERRMLLHGQLRGISDIPLFIDWVEAIDPIVWGPHIDQDGETFYCEDRGLWEKSPYLVISYFDGKQIDEYCKSPRGRQNPLGFCKTLGQFLANTLQAFHRKVRFDTNDLCFIYQDLKPANILCSWEGHFQLIDFGGLAVVSAQGAYNAGIGTPGYAAPEASQGGVAVTPQLDIYSLGIVLKECLQLCSGIDKPNKNEDFAGWALDAGWKQVLNTCTATALEKRYKTMDGVITDLKKLPAEGQTR